MRPDDENPTIDEPDIDLQPFNKKDARLPADRPGPEKGARLKRDAGKPAPRD